MGSKEEQVMNDLASFYVSKSDFDFEVDSPTKGTPPTSDSEEQPQEEAPVQRNVFISQQDVTSRRRRPQSKPNKAARAGLPTVGEDGPLDREASSERRRARRAASRDGRRSGRRKSDEAENNDVRKDSVTAGASALERLKSRSQSRERRTPLRSKSDDGLKGSNHLSRSNHRPRRRGSNDGDVIASESGDDSGRTRRAPPRSRSDDGMLTERGSRRGRRAQAKESSGHEAETEYTDETNSAAQHSQADGEAPPSSGGAASRLKASTSTVSSDGEDDDAAPSAAGLSALAKLKGAVGNKGGSGGMSALDKLRSATKTGELADLADKESGGGGGRRSSKWAGLKGGMDFIHKAKAEAEEQKRTGKHRRDRRKEGSSSSSRKTSGGHSSPRRRPRSPKTSDNSKLSPRSMERLKKDLKDTEDEYSQQNLTQTNNDSSLRKADSQENNDVKEEKSKKSAASLFKGLLSKSKKHHDSETEDKEEPQSLPAETTDSKPSSQRSLSQPNSDSILKKTASQEDIDDDPVKEEKGKKAASSIFKSLLSKSKKHESETGAKEEPKTTESTTENEETAATPDTATADAEEPLEQKDKKKSKASMLKNLLSKSEHGKKSSKWTGLKGGMDFTSRLMHKTKQHKDDKHTHEKEDEDKQSQELKVGAETDLGKGEKKEDGKDQSSEESKSKKKGGRWGIGGSKKEEKDEEKVMDYNLMMSMASFSPDAMDGLPDFQPGETIAEDDEDDSEAEESENTDDLMAPHKDQALADQGGSEDAFAMLSGGDDGSTGKDAFALFSGAAPDEETKPHLNARNDVMKMLAAPSIRFDFDLKTETAKEHSRPDVIEEGDEEEEESDEEESKPLSRRSAPSPIQEESEESDGSLDFVGEHLGQTEEELPTKGEDPIAEEKQEEVDGHQPSHEALPDMEEDEQPDKPVEEAEEVEYEDDSEHDEGDMLVDGPCLSPFKCMQLKIDLTDIAAPNCSASLGVSIHALLEVPWNNEDAGVETKSEEDVAADRIQQMEWNGKDYEASFAPQQSRKSSIRERRRKDMESSGHSDKRPSSMLSLGAQTTEQQEEYDRIWEALEQSKKRTTESREAVRVLQQEIQKQRHHYDEVERHRQQALKNLEKNKVVLHRVGGS